MRKIVLKMNYLCNMKNVMNSSIYFSNVLCIWTLIIFLISGILFYTVKYHVKSYKCSTNSCYIHNELLQHLNGETALLSKYGQQPPSFYHEKYEPDIVSESEAVGSLYAALEMKREGKKNKALKLFKHALALAPHHPDVLNHYGEFLEETDKDIVSADQLYVQALVHSPNHQGALSNRHRTAVLVEELDQRMLQHIDNKRDLLSTVPNSNAALRKAKKEAYFMHIYHTVAIEGNTMSLQQTRAVVETRTAISGKSIDEHNEILGLDSAMKYINSTLVHRIGSVTVRDILDIHTRVLGHIDPVEGGHFRRTQVYVGGHIPPGPGEIALLMEYFVEWLNSEAALTLHPVRYAALAHYKLVHIHPFTDGNGRTSRLLMNMILMHSGFPPVIIPKQHRHKYYETLQMANDGDVRPFVRFIAQCTEHTLDMYLWATSEHAYDIPALEQPSANIGIVDDTSSEWLHIDD